jgi:hypothetical protein
MTNPQSITPEPDIRATTAPRFVPSREAHVNTTLQDEIHLLRQRGLSDECIHGLFSGFNIDANPEPSGQHWNLPVNDQLIGLIWGKTLPTH